MSGDVVESEDGDMQWIGPGGRRGASTALVALVLAALVASGCGSDDGSDGSRSGSRDGGDSGTVTPRTPTRPEPDTELTSKLGPAAATLTAAGCTAGTFAEEEAQHVEEQDELRHDTFPPTSGRHYPEWAPFGRYDEPIDDGYAVHNLEHGAVVVWLGTEVDDALADAIGELLDDDEKWVVAPRRDLTGLYSAAWRTGLDCPPAALEELGAEATATALDSWYDAVVSTGSDAEKDIPAFAGSMKEPAPVRDISADPPS